MELSSLTAVGPLDGRYRNKIAALAPFFSEYALIRYRVLVEIEYFIALHETGISPLLRVSEEESQKLRALYQSFDMEMAAKVKEIESRTNHDVKAVEYLIKDYIQKEGFSEALVSNIEFVHFGLTSQDINNNAIPLMLKESLEQVYLPQLDQVISILSGLAKDWRNLPMLARTHGQPASPTTLGKEFAVFVKRLETQRDELASIPIPAKFGGATGNLNAHYVAYPEVNWKEFSQNFVENILGLHYSYPTTQVEHYDGLAKVFDCIKRINSIVIDLCQDVWIYVSMEYFRQKVKAGEVGSSAMPHKVNPIDFENAEGNCGLSTAVLEFLSRKLPVSRLQRDLTDSTILRNVGVGIGYTFLALKSVQKGLGKLLVNEDALKKDLDKNWAVLAEAIQTILRREKYPQPYEALKALTRGNHQIDAEAIQTFIRGLNVQENVKKELLALTPEAYIGNAGK